MAKGWFRGKPAASARVETTGAPARIKFIPDRAILAADGEDVVLITAAVVDTKGRVVPNADNQIDFSVSNNARILGVGNGDPSSHEPDKAPRRRAFNGFCQLIIQVSRVAGSIQVKAQSPGLKNALLTLRAKPALIRPCVPAKEPNLKKRRALSA
jgi:beta-galactosidase